MENPEKLATYEDNQNKTTTHYVLGTLMRKQPHIT